MFQKNCLGCFETSIRLKTLVSYNSSQALLDQITTGISTKDKSPPAKDSIA